MVCSFNVWVGEEEEEEEEEEQEGLRAVADVLAGKMCLCRIACPWPYRKMTAGGENRIEVIMVVTGILP